MIFTPFRQLPIWEINRVQTVFFFISFLLVTKLGWAEPTQDYSFEKSNSVLIADSLLYWEYWKDAEKYYQEAYHEYLIEKNWGGVVYTLNKIGWTKIANRYEEEKGNITLEKAKKIIVEQNLSESLNMADFYMYKGIYSDRSERFESAMYYHDKAIALKKKILGDISTALAESYRFKAQSLSENGYMSKAENLYRECLNIYEKSKPVDNLKIAKIYSMLSSVFRKKYDYENAVLFCENSIQLSKNSNPYLVNTIIISQLKLANIHNSFLKYNKAIEAYNQAYYLILDDPKSNRFHLYYLYQNIATLYNQVNKPDSALFYVIKARNKLSNEGLSDIAFESLLDLISGLSYGLKGNHVLSKKLANTALKNFLRLYDKGHPFIVTSYEKLGEIYSRSGELDSALFFFQKALVQLVPDFENMDVNTNPDKVGRLDALQLYDILYKKANTFRNKYFTNNSESDLVSAIKIYNLIDEINDETRNSKMAEGSLLEINKYYKKDYEKGIDCAYLLHKNTSSEEYLQHAFNLMEKSKYMLLFKSLAMAETHTDFNLPIDVKGYEDSLKSQYISFQLKLDSENSKDKPDQNIVKELENNAFSYAKALDDFRIYVQENFPSYAEIKYDSLTKTYGDFKNYCEKNNCLGIEYYWGEKAIYMITTDMDHPIYKIDRTMELDSAIQVILSFLGKGYSMSTLEEDFKLYTWSAPLVYKYLLKEALESNNGQKSLLIIPDGHLSQLPFEVLLNDEISDDYVDYSRLPYLIQTYEPGYAYSANLLLSKLENGDKSEKKLLAFSYSSIEALTSKNGRSGDQNELHHTAIELRAIRKEMGRKKSRYYYDLDATESLFKEEASNYNIIHLAVHGETDTASAMNSKLLFKDSLETEEDGRLYMHELYGLDLSRANLAVLSACETGIGKIFEGEGVFSMARGFAYAGCPSIVMSLWRVNDKYTAELMASFYKKLNKGNNITESLTNSKREFIAASDELRAHPSNWAAFVPVGKNPVIARKSYTLYYALFLLVVVAIYLLYIKFKR